jgi:hypothetical protein
MAQYTAAEGLKLTVFAGSVPVDAGRRTVIKTGLAWTALALWQAEPLIAEETIMAENKMAAHPPVC